MKKYQIYEASENQGVVDMIYTDTYEEAMSKAFELIISNNLTKSEKAQSWVAIDQLETNGSDDEADWEYINSINDIKYINTLDDVIILGMGAGLKRDKAYSIIKSVTNDEVIDSETVVALYKLFLNEKKNKNNRIMIRIDDQTKEAIERAAKAENRSVSNYMLTAVMEKINKEFDK